MGPRLKLPHTCAAFVDRHGRPRFYYRRPGFKRTPFARLAMVLGLHARIRGRKGGRKRTPVGVRQSRPGTVAAAVTGYFSSLAFACLADTTRLTRRRILERFREEHRGGRASPHSHSSTSSGCSTRRPKHPAVRSNFSLLSRHSCGMRSTSGCERAIQP